MQGLGNMSFFEDVVTINSEATIFKGFDFRLFYKDKPVRAFVPQKSCEVEGAIGNNIQIFTDLRLTD